MKLSINSLIKILLIILMLHHNEKNKINEALGEMETNLNQLI